MIPQPLEVLVQLMDQIQLGKSVHFGLKNVCQNLKGRYSEDLSIWLARYENGQRGKELRSGLEELTRSDARKNLLDVLEKGLGGAAILTSLKNLREEFLLQCEIAFERQLQLLPIKLLLPLVLGFFPAVICLIVGPAFFAITSQLGGM